jgi:predicted RNA-binding Zn-ribbon protein involved in translation (DUF1610 family)
MKCPKCGEEMQRREERTSDKVVYTCKVCDVTIVEAPWNLQSRT